MQKRLLKKLCVTCVFVLSGCGALSEQADETANWSASKLYAEARDELASNNFERAVTLFEKLESRYPFGTYAQQAQMEIAYTHYRQGDQPLALAAVERFIKLHPNHPNVDYMYYLRGLINFNDRLGVFNFVARQDLTERDPKAAREAFDAFKTLVERYPDSKYAADALARLNYLINAMAQYEVHVAQYYFRRGAYVAAANRAQTAVREYRTAPAVEDALKIMVRSYDALNMPQLRDDAVRVLKQNYPDSSLSNNARSGTKDPWWKLW
jgi:outer membrane protein assembly factor BamD